MNTGLIIKNKVGNDSYQKGLVYPRQYVRYLGYKLTNMGKQHLFNVESSTYDDYYQVRVTEKENEIVSMYCECIRFTRNGTCKHIAASLLKYSDQIFDISEEDIEKIVTNKIFNRFKKEKNTSKIKKQLNLEVELDFIKANYTHYNEEAKIGIKIKIGTDKMYILNNKMHNFLRCYDGNDSIVELGKTFAYDKNIHYFSEQDKKILDEFIHIYKYSYYQGQGIFLNSKEKKYFFDLLKDKDIIVNGYGMFNGIRYDNPIKLKLVKEKDNYNLQIANYKDNIDLLDNFEFIINGGELYHLTGDILNLLQMMKEEGINKLVFNDKNLNNFEDSILPIIKQNISISEELKDKIQIGKEPTPKIYIDYKNEQIEVIPKFDYGKEEISYFDNGEVIRDQDFEDKIINDLLKYNLEIANDKLVIIELEKIVQFINNFIEELGNKYEVFTTNRLKKTKILTNTSITSNFSIGQDNILKYDFDLGEIDKKEIVNVLDSLRRKDRYYRLKNGNIIKLYENENLAEFDKLVDNMDINSSDIKNASGIIPKYKAIYIDSLREGKNSIIESNNLFDELVSNFKKYKDADIKLTDADYKILRDYQLVGIKWLYNIYKCGFGGILADEMGLGKSIQLIYLIRQIIEEKKNSKILIISPTSLVYNWENEIKKFAPSIKYKVMAENKLKRKDNFSNLDDVNVIITTYGLIRQDKEEYENMYFELVAIDEAQNIKNNNSQSTKEVKSLNANTKIALTGTPIENSVLELWSIFDFIMPGYLANLKVFSSKYNVKDVDNANLKKLEILNRQIKPFIMRRRKQDVMKELPPKIENNIYINLTKEQKKIYVAELDKTKEEVDKLLGTEGFQKASFKILQLLTKLRQICIDPKIVYENYNGDSAKIENLVKTVKEIVNNNHKILIFTNFLTALDIVNRELNNNGISTYIIDGSVSSKKRMELVDKFNNDDTNVFLITLKAGGTGLNLTSADVVIHLDMWWNPQVENQATDRAHRIGQKKTVEVIKFIATGTIEERILELQNKKKLLSSSLIDGKNMEENIISKLTEKDIKRLLAIDNKE